jgi:hypothetical protein
MVPTNNTREFLIPDIRGEGCSNTEAGLNGEYCTMLADELGERFTITQLQGVIAYIERVLSGKLYPGDEIYKLGINPYSYNKHDLIAVENRVALAIWKQEKLAEDRAVKAARMKIASVADHKYDWECSCNHCKDERECLRNLKYVG